MLAAVPIDSTRPGVVVIQRVEIAGIFDSLVAAIITRWGGDAVLLGCAFAGGITRATIADLGRVLDAYWLHGRRRAGSRSAGIW